MNPPLRRIAPLVLVVLFLPAFHALAEEWQLPTPANGIAVDSDGSVWTLHQYDVPYVLRHGATIARTDLPALLSWPQQILAARYEGVWVVSPDGVGLVSAEGHVVMVRAIEEQPRAAAVAPDGNLWVSTAYRQAAVITPAGDVQTFPVASPGSVRAIAFDADGRAWFACSEALLRIERDLAVTQFTYPGIDFRWIVADREANLITSGGLLSPDGRLERRDFPGDSPAVSIDGRVWVAEARDSVIAVDLASGDEAMFPATRGGELGTAVATASDAVWVTTGISLRRIPLDATRPDTAPRIGDFAVREWEASGGFPWGTHLFTLYRTQNEPIVLHLQGVEERMWTDEVLPPQFTQDGRLLTVATHRVHDIPESHAVLELGRKGEVSRELPLSLPRGTSVLALFAHPRRELWLLTELTGNLSLDRFSADGVQIDSIPLPERTTFGAPLGFDVTGDGCTIGYFERIDVKLRRFNVCTRTDVEDVALATEETGYPFRFLPDGRILAATSTEIVLFLPDGSRQRAYPGVYAVALDPVPGSFWAASPNGRALRRIDFATSTVVDEFDLYGNAEDLAIFGEPRASAPLPPRRRGVRRNSFGTSSHGPASSPQFNSQDRSR
ncbi:MAG: NHL repeat-containing protein [Thermoanaerobaculia bacterium]